MRSSRKSIKSPKDSPAIARSREIMAKGIATMRTMRTEVEQVVKQLREEDRAIVAAGGGLPHADGRPLTPQWWAADALGDLIKTDIGEFVKVLEMDRTENWQATIEQWIAGNIEDAAKFAAREAEKARVAAVAARLAEHHQWAMLVQSGVAPEKAAARVTVAGALRGMAADVERGSIGAPWQVSSTDLERALSV